LVEFAEGVEATNEVREVAAETRQPRCGEHQRVHRRCEGHPHTLLFIETENGKSICGSYLDPAWVENGFTNDPSRQSFLFTLKNHIGVPPMTFRLTGSDKAAYANRSRWVQLTADHSGGVHLHSGKANGSFGHDENSIERGAQGFNGDDGGGGDDGDGENFRDDRWESWETM
jgi:hypothetical protein